MARVLLIGTFETKAEELGYLARALSGQGLEVETLDLSLSAGGAALSGPDKLARMQAKARAAAPQIVARSQDCAAVVGVGGGTGGEIVLTAMEGLPAEYPKVLITTLPFDPRAALADTAITLIPTLCDIEGLNPTLRQVFENAAAMIAGLAKARLAPQAGQQTVAVTTLGATGAAGAEIVQALKPLAFEATVFHANGYGGAAFARFVEDGKAAAVIDLNVHELGRLRLAGAHVPMPTRFSCASSLPRVVLPGALNFIGLGAIDTIPEPYRRRLHYAHSGHFTHIKLTPGEMADQATALAQALNDSQAPCKVVIPMGGFSHEDRPGGAIEDPELREIAAQTLEAEARAYSVTRLPHHINSAETAAAVVAALSAALSQRTPNA